MAVSVVAIAHTEVFKRGQMIKLSDRSFIVRKVVPRVGLVLRPARWYDFLLYKIAYAIAKRNKERL